jgi:hypothetical protein
VTNSLANTLRELAERVLESPEDRKRFMEAARVLFELDPDIKRLSQRQRSKLISGPASAEALAQAIMRAFRDIPMGEIKPDADLTRRVLAAYVVARCFPSGQDRLVLSKATHLLRDIRDQARADSLRVNGRKCHEQNPRKKSPKDKALETSLRQEAARIRENAPSLRKTDRARRLMRHSGGRFTSHKALMMWMHRRGIEI